MTSRFGSPEDTLRRTLETLPETLGVIRKKSQIYRTPAFPAGTGPDYANGAISLETSLSAQELLNGLHEVEARHGRERAERWGRRTLDLDLLAHGDAILPDPVTWGTWADLSSDQQRMRAPDELILPHPRLHERGFVLVPLAEIEPDWRHPVLDLTVAELLADLPEAFRAEVKPIGELEL